MFGKKKQPPIKSLIAQGTVIRGDIEFSAGVRIDGEVVGNLRATLGSGSMLVISESAVVTGEVEADHVVLNGTVRGPVRAADLLELQPKAKVDGDVTYKSLEMHQGAVITGQLAHLQSSLPMPKPDADSPTKPPLKLATNRG